MLSILSMLAMLSDWICFSLAPVPDHTEEAFDGLHPAHLITIFLSTNVFFCFIEPLIVRSFGLRKTVVGGSILMTIGCVLRSGIGRQHPVTNVFQIIVGTLCVGAAQPFFQCTPSLLAAEWFGPGERTLATTVAINANQIGIAFSYICGAYFIHDVPGLFKYLRLLSCFATFLCVLTILFFQSRPPTPPSASSSNLRSPSKINRQIGRGVTFRSDGVEEELAITAALLDPTIIGKRWNKDFIDFMAELRKLLVTNGFRHATVAFVVSSKSDIITAIQSSCTNNCLIVLSTNKN